MKGSVKLPVFIDDARKLVNTTQLRAKYLGASYESEYCQWQLLHGLGSLMQTASLIITPNAYLEGKLLASYPPDPIGDFDVTRATTATRVNSAGLVELVPYNLVQYSQDLSNTWYTANGILSSNATTAPDGTLTADKIIADTTNGIHVYQQTVSITSGVVHTLSVFVKAAEYSVFELADASSLYGQTFNLTTQTISVAQTGSFNPATSASITDEGNGWYRCSITYTSNSTTAFTRLSLSNGTTTSFAGNGVNGSFVWGAQLVEGSTAKDYQKTETRLNIPRLDYSNGTCPSILVEPQRTNLNLYSEDLSNAWYSKFNSSISTNSTTSPSGISNANKIIENTNNSFHYVETANSLSAGSQYTISAYLKKAERDFGYIGIYTFESKQIRVDLVNGTIDNTVGTWTNTNIEDAGNGWYRVSGTFDAYSTSYFFAGPALNATTVTYTGNGTSGIYLWGAQLEAGSYATSYIATTSASVTRNADVISKTGISSLIGQTEGTLFVDVDLKSRTNFNYIALNNSGGTSNYISIYFLDNAMGLECVFGSSAQAAIQYNNSSTGIFKIAIAYKNNDFVLYVNGNLIGTDISGSVPTCDVLDLTAYNRANQIGINSAALWKTRLTNTQLEQLTTI